MGEPVDLHPFFLYALLLGTRVFLEYTSQKCGY